MTMRQPEGNVAPGCHKIWECEGRGKGL